MEWFIKNIGEISRKMTRSPEEEISGGGGGRKGD